MSATLKRGKKEQNELDQIYEKKVINLELKLGNLLEFKNEDQCWRRNTILRNIDNIRKNENEDFDEYCVTKILSDL